MFLDCAFKKDTQTLSKVSRTRYPTFLTKWPLQHFIYQAVPIKSAPTKTIKGRQYFVEKLTNVRVGKAQFLLEGL